MSPVAAVVAAWFRRATYLAKKSEVPITSEPSNPRKIGIMTSVGAPKRQRYRCWLLSAQ